MMLSIYNRMQNNSEEIKQFMQSLRESSMTYLASDLLDSGVAPQEIIDGIGRAVTSMTTIGIDHREHYKRVYTSAQGRSIRDCKMTKLGYSMLMLNISPANRYIAKYQLQVAKLLMSQ